MYTVHYIYSIPHSFLLDYFLSLCIDLSDKIALGALTGLQCIVNNNQTQRVYSFIGDQHSIGLQ
jgi:hypothetical protein